MLDLILNAEVWTPRRLGPRHLVIGGGRLLAVSETPPELPDELVGERFDAAGSRVVPGLIDAHVHLTGGGGEAGPSSKVPPLGLSRLTSSGVTSAVGVLGTDDTTRSTESLVTAARALCELGLDAWCYTGGYHLPPTTLTGSVRRDIVFVDRILGVGEIAISDHRSSQPTLDELLRIAADAHVAGLMTGKAGILHLHLGDGPRGLELVRRALAESEIPPRTFHPTHVNRKRALFDEALELAALGCTVDLTAFPEPPEGADELWAPDALERYWEAGLPAQRVTVSSDGGGCLPTFDSEGRVASYDIGDPSALLATVRELFRRGHGLDVVLPPFTSNVSDLLRLPGKGHLIPGSDADLLLLGENLALEGVMVGGRWHLRDGGIEIQGPFENRIEARASSPECSGEGGEVANAATRDLGSSGRE